MVLVSAVRQPPAPAPDGMDIQAMTAWLTALVSRTPPPRWVAASAKPAGLAVPVERERVPVPAVRLPLPRECLPTSVASFALRRHSSKSVDAVSPVRLIDPRGHGFGAALSAVILGLALPDRPMLHRVTARPTADGPPAHEPIDGPCLAWAAACPSASRGWQRSVVPRRCRCLRRARS